MPPSSSAFPSWLVQACRPWGCRECWGSQILADKLTLSQPRGAEYAHQIILAPPDFQTFRQPCSVNIPTMGPNKRYGGSWVYYLVRDIKPPILFPPIFSTNFSQLEQLKKKTNFLLFFSVLDQWKVCILFQLVKLRNNWGKTRLVVWCHEQDNRLNYHRLFTVKNQIFLKGFVIVFA